MRGSRGELNIHFLLKKEKNNPFFFRVLLLQKEIHKEVKSQCSAAGIYLSLTKLCPCYGVSCGFALFFGLVPVQIALVHLLLKCYCCGSVGPPDLGVQTC